MHAAAHSSHVTMLRPVRQTWRNKCVRVKRVGIRKYSENEGYIRRRLEELAENAPYIKDDPFKRKQREELEQRKYEYENQRILSHGKIPRYAPKQARDIAESVPWRGTESTYDVNLRMLTDVHKPLSSKGLEPPKRKRIISRSERLSLARENSLDYVLNKEAHEKEESKSPGGEDHEQSSFREQYRDRFLGSGGMGSAIAMVNSLASQRIEDAIARGQFKNLPRGKPLEDLPKNPYVDTTTHFLNNMIQRQGALPPWVEKQQIVNTEVERFRKALKNKCVKYTVRVLVEKSRQDADLAKQYCRENVYNPQKDMIWFQDDEKYYHLWLDKINSSIRGYNLQAPGSARKGYMDIEKELNACRETCMEDIIKGIDDFFGTKEDEPQPPTAGYLHQSRMAYHEDPSNYYGFMDLVKDLAKKVWKKTA